MITKPPSHTELIDKLLELYRKREARLGLILRSTQAKAPPSGSPDEIANELAAADKALLEIFSDPKLPRFPPRHRWVFDADRQQFVRDEFDLMLERTFKEVFGIEDEDADLDRPRPLPLDKPK